MLEVVKLGIEGYHGVWHGTDSSTGFDGIVAVHNINLGIALGGCRAVKYDSFEEHLKDVLALSKGMTYKNSLVGLDNGGGKTAINLKDGVLTPNILKSLAEMLNIINGDEQIYVTGGDVGTSNDDLIYLSEMTEHVWGYEGMDSGKSTAYGVFMAMQHALKFRDKKIKDQIVSISGFGKVGARLGKFIADTGGFVIAADVRNPFEGISGFPQNHGLGSVVNNHTNGTVFAPCALGEALNGWTTQGIPRGNLVCGGANNQIQNEGILKIIADREIDYVPDYLANAGGVVFIAAKKRGGHDLDWDTPEIREKLNNIGVVAGKVLEEAEARGLPTAQVADEIAEERFNGGRVDMPHFVVG